MTVRVRECEPRGLLAQIVFIDLVGLGEDDARDTLLANVCDRRTKPDVRPVFPGKSPRSMPERPAFPAAPVCAETPQGDSPSAEAGADALDRSSAESPPNPAKGLVPTAPRPTSASSNASAFNLPAELDPAAVRRAEQELTLHLGPMAKILVRKAAVNARTLTDLYRLLAAAIPVEDERKAFLRQGAEASAGRAVDLTLPVRTRMNPGDALSPSRLEQIGDELTDRLGPIAKVLIQQALREASSPEDFHRRLANHLPDGAERAAFLQRRSAERV